MRRSYLIFRHGHLHALLLVPGRDLQRAPAGAAVRAREERRPPLRRAAARQQIVQQGRATRADERVEGRYGEHAQLVQRLLRGARHVRQ